MRKDLRIDGFTFGTVQVGGMDATATLLAMIADLKRRDLNAIMLSGCVIAWFNIIDPERIFDETDIPVIGVSYEESSGLNEEIRTHFPEIRSVSLAIRNWGRGTRLRCIRERRCIFAHGGFPYRMRHDTVTTSCMRAVFRNPCGWPVSVPEDCQDMPVRCLHQKGYTILARKDDFK